MDHLDRNRSSKSYVAGHLSRIACQHKVGQAVEADDAAEPRVEKNGAAVGIAVFDSLEARIARNPERGSATRSGFGSSERVGSALRF